MADGVIKQVGGQLKDLAVETVRKTGEAAAQITGIAVSEKQAEVPSPDKQAQVQNIKQLEQKDKIEKKRALERVRNELMVERKQTQPTAQEIEAIEQQKALAKKQRTMAPLKQPSTRSQRGSWLTPKQIKEQHAPERKPGRGPTQ